MHCPHYKKRCSLIAPCCGHRVCCHRCHDQEFRHTLPRRQLQEAVCNSCRHIQPLASGDTCGRCGVVFAAYFCTECGIANDDVPPEGYFHCTECGICRVGSRHEYFHCDGCGCCLRQEHMGNHTCHPGALDSPCPICLQGPMFDSKQAAHNLPCGHMAHMACIQALLREGSSSSSSSADNALDGICRACSSGTRSSNLGHSSTAEPPYDQAGASSSSGAGGARGAGSSPGCSSAYVTDLLELLSGTIEPSEAPGVREMLQELARQPEGNLLPQRIVTFEAANSLDLLSSASATLHDMPRQFRQCLEAAILRSLLLGAPELAATNRAVDAVIQALEQSASRGDLVWGGRGAAGSIVSIDRCVVAGSVGKRVNVQGQFDVDLVAFANIPTNASAYIDLCDPEASQRSTLMHFLREQLVALLCRHLPRSQQLRVVTEPQAGQNAVKFTLQVRVPENEAVFELRFDVLLVPSMAAGAGAAAAAAAGIRPSGPAAEIQTQAVLAPVLAEADAALVRSHSWPARATDAASVAVKPAYMRSVWLAEASTTFLQQAAVVAARPHGLSGRVVTSTIRLVKAWVRRGLQPSAPGYRRLKGFMLELMVLQAARIFVRRLERCDPEAVRVQHQYGGRYVLDLLLEALAVVMHWAALATGTAGGTGCPWLSHTGSSSSSASSSGRPIMFTDMIRSPPYSEQQALALQQLAKRGTWPGHEGLYSAQPVVLHPVDPLCNVFDQPEGHRFELWADLGTEAAQLMLALMHWRWQEIMDNTTLGQALKVWPL